MFMGKLCLVFSERCAAGMPQGAVLAAAGVVVIQDYPAGGQCLPHPPHGLLQGIPQLGVEGDLGRLVAQDEDAVGDELPGGVLEELAIGGQLQDVAGLRMGMVSGLDLDGNEMVILAQDVVRFARQLETS